MTRTGPTTSEAVWNEGDFRRLSGGATLVGELLCEAIELHALERVLDVGCGNGNTSISAARRRAVVIGVDPTEKLLEHARQRAQVDGLEIEFRHGNAEHLDVPDGSFDVVLSTFGVAFAGNAEKAARELVRVVRPGGRIGLANWSEGLVPEQFRIVAPTLHKAGIPFDPLRWGRLDELTRLLGPEVRTVRADRHVRNLRGDSVEAQVRGVERFLGPVATAFGLVDDAGKERFRQQFTELVTRLNTAQDGTVFAPSEYLEFVGEVSRR